MAGCSSNTFRVSNGVRQGGILSPKLFNVYYMDELSEQLNNSNVGQNLGGQLINPISYADDMCLLSFSAAGMREKQVYL